MNANAPPTAYKREFLQTFSSFFLELLKEIQKKVVVSCLGREPKKTSWFIPWRYLTRCCNMTTSIWWLAGPWLTQLGVTNPTDYTPESLTWNLKINHIEKESHLPNLNLWVQNVNFPGCIFSSTVYSSTVYSSNYQTSFCMMSCTGAAGWGMDAATVSTSRRK